jgi:hypothetical protein
MKKLSDKFCAERMLQARERGGPSFLSFLRTNAKAHIFLILYFGAMITVLALAQIWPAVFIILGLAIGVFLRDLSWIIGIRRTWAFSVKVTDWEKVQKLADEKPLT